MPLNHSCSSVEPVWISLGKSIPYCHWYSIPYQLPWTAGGEVVGGERGNTWDTGDSVIAMLISVLRTDTPDGLGGDHSAPVIRVRDRHRSPVKVRNSLGYCKVGSDKHTPVAHAWPPNPRQPPIVIRPPRWILARLHWMPYAYSRMWMSARGQNPCPKSTSANAKTCLPNSWNISAY